MKKPKPNFESAGQPPMTSEITRPPSAVSRKVAAEKQTTSKARSSPVPRAARSGAAAEMSAVAVMRLFPVCRTRAFPLRSLLLSL